MSSGGSSGLAHFLCVPTKKTWEVDLGRPLRGFIESVYRNISPEECVHALNELNRLRLYYVTKINEKHESTLDVCCRYADQLQAIETKFPIDENQIRIGFRWQDAFSRRFQQLSSGTYEYLCALFNVGAMQGQVADIQNVTTDEGLKTAAKLFQQASGTFAHLQKTVPTVVVTGELTSDLWPDSLGAMSALMLAQAQECFVRKAMSDKMKPGVIAKLAQQCAVLYEDAQKLMSGDKIKNIWPRDWMTGIIARQEAARGLAEYHQSIVAKEAKNFGEQVSRLRVAKEFILKAQKHGLNSSVHQPNIKLISDAAASAEKDNGLIYNALIPDHKSLTGIDKAVMSKPIPVVHPVSGSEFRDLFEHIVPIPVQMALSTFESRKSDILQQEIGRLRSSTQALNSILASLNLPAAIEDLSSGGAALPQSLQVKAATVRRAGGIQYLERLTNDLPALLQRNLEMLNECDRLLNDEEASDRQLRGQFGQRWVRTPSQSLNVPIKAEASRYRSVINNAMASDGNVRQRFAAHRNDITLLSQTDTDIQRALPGGGGTSAAGLQGHPAVATLRKLMEQVNSIKQERDQLESELKNSQAGDMSAKFLTALAQDGAIKEESLSLEQLDRIYGPMRNRVSQSIQRQDDAIDSIQRANREFTDARSSSSSGGGAMSRDQKLKQLASAYDAFTELRSNIEEGVRFYNDLTQLLIRFQGKVSDFCFARKTEKDEHMKDLTSGLAGTGSPPQSPSGGGFGMGGHLDGARLMSSVNVGPITAPSAAFGSKTTMTIGGGSGSNGGYCLPAMPGGYNPYAGGCNNFVMQAPAQNHGYAPNARGQRR